jgi:PAS domain S-box-containing protein
MKKGNKIESELKRLKDQVAELEAALEKSEDNYGTLCDNFHEMFVSVDAKTAKIVRCNQTLLNVLGYTMEEIIGQPITFVYHSDCEDVRQKVFRSFEEAGKVRNAELQLRRKDGSNIDVILNVTSILNDNGEQLYSRSVWRDITECEQLHEQMLQAQKMQTVGAFTKGVVHEFNNILTVIISLSSLAQQKFKDEDLLKDYLEPIQEVSIKATNLVQQLLIFSQQKPLELDVIDLNDTTETLLSMLESLTNDNISIESKLEYGLWKIQADRVRLEQVITNLVANSSDAMLQGGKITLYTENITLSEEDTKGIPGLSSGKFVCLTVEDTGTGMDSDTLERIFEPFFTTKSQGGAGLGLVITHAIVSELKGGIDVVSVPGQGSRFMVYLPALEQQIDIATQKPTEQAAVDGEGRRILLVEDDKWVRKSTAVVLSKSGYVVSEAINAEDAIRLFYRKKGQFDLVLSDVVMPGMSGPQMVSTFRELHAEIPVLFFSAFLDDQAELNQITEGGFSYIQKPYETSDLLQAIEETLSQSH